MIFFSWTGDKALRELQEANISQQCFPTLQECATKVLLYLELNLTSLLCLSSSISNSDKYFYYCCYHHQYNYFLPPFKAIKAASDAEQDAPNLTGMSATMLEGINLTSKNSCTNYKPVKFCYWN